MKTQMKQPVTGKRAKVPVIMQMEALECGAASLAMVLAYYQKWIPLEQVRSDCGVSRDGSNALNILKAARNYGMEANGGRYDLNMLREKATYPCIIHWNFNHFVVLRGLTDRYAWINDPAKGDVRIPMEEFDRSFTGIVLFFKPGEQFKSGGKRKSTMEFASGRLKAAGSAVLFVLLTSLVGCLFEVINPAFSRFFMDRLLTGENRELFSVFILILAGAGLLQVAAEGLNGWYSLKINGKMDIVGSSTYLWKVMRLPMVFFTQRRSGDIMQRGETNANISKTLVQTLMPLVFNVFMMLFYLVVMIRYSVLITLIGMAVVCVNLLMTRVIARKRVNITRVQKRDNSNLISSTVSGIQMIETIKASGAENGYFKKWAGYQASVNTQFVRYEKVRQFLGMIPMMLTDLTSALVLIIGTWLTLKGQFTIGMILCFQGLMNSFMMPATNIMNAGQQIQEMRTDMERIDDVMEYPNDPHFRDEPFSEDQDYSKLGGSVELKNVTFGYSRLEPPLVENFSMTLRPGSRVAFVGASGCGKSTLSRLISGLYQPWSGEVLFDGKKIPEIERSVFTGSVAVVDQDIILFEDTIANNIKMWNDSIQEFEMILAAHDAQIYDDIMTREGGFYGMIHEGGRDLSGGQRQRLEIARVLAQDPSIIIMDEATSALDAKTEFELVNAIRKRGITCVVIAHRLSTIRDCDEIIVLDKGKVVERGTHEELMALNGAYRKLVSDD